MPNRLLLIHALLLVSIGLLMTVTPTLAHAEEDHVTPAGSGGGWIGVAGIIVTAALVFLMTRRETSRRTEPGSDTFHNFGP